MKFQENEGVIGMDDLVASYPSPLVFPASSTPIRPPTQQICQHAPKISPIERVRSAEFEKSDTASVLDGSCGERSNAAFSDKHYTKLGNVADIHNSNGYVLGWMWVLLIESI